MTEYLSEILGNFVLDAPAIICGRFGHGHINETYIALTETGRRYILQKINNRVFPNVPALMENIVAVTKHLRGKISDPDGVLSLVPTRQGTWHLAHEDGSFWRLYDFVDHSLCLQTPETAEDFYQSAIAFGHFQQQLADFPAYTLHETIANFHNTADRYRIFREKLAQDPCNRAKDVQPEIEFALAREREAATLVNMLAAGELPLRVTHNDTKLNNVMLDARTRKPLCVIDLDTVMPGLSLYDFGDSIRFGAATAAEDERDLSKAEMSLDLFRIYTRGFLSACPGLMEKEKKMLPMGAKLMTLECGVRFLTDYLDGDCYFATQREGQNLDRCRTQLKLVADMEEKWAEMATIVTEEE